ncbi:MAG: prepilin peptidase, partial [Actinomycetota bacterium]
MRVAIFAVLGLLAGSFLTVVVYRVPRRESIVSPGSRCLACGTGIRALDNIPVVSYLALRCRCRNCGERISPEYPLTELTTAGLFVAAALLLEPLYAASLVALFLALMLAIGLIDARHKIVPNRIVYPA